MAEYDSISDDYVKTLSTMRRKHVYDYSLFENIGSVLGMDVIDIACGEGIITREIKSRGASRVVGVDNSIEQIRKALAEEARNPLGIEYVCSPGEDVSTDALFGIAIGSYYLHYAKSSEELSRMIGKLSDLLVPGGRLVAMNLNPYAPVAERGKWGSRYTWIDEPMRDGSRVLVGLTDEKSQETCRFVNYHYNISTYNTILDENGFSEIEWHRPVISPDGIEKLGEEYWEGFDGIEPGVLVLAARKR